MASLPIGSDSASRLCAVLERYIKTAERFIASPRYKPITEYRVTSVRSAKRTDATSARWLAAHSSCVERCGDGIAVSEALIPQKRISYDTAENRFVRYTLDMTVKRLREWAQNVQTRDDRDGEGLKEKAEKTVAALQRMLTQSFLHRLSDVREMPRISMSVMSSECREINRCALMLERELEAYDAYLRSASPVKKLSVPSGTERLITETDWTADDVLVGSVGSVGQFSDNLRRSYYYVPERYMLSVGSLRYVAIYQSMNLFGEDAGIRYYGEITQTRRVKRKRICFPMRRNNGDEWYYAFRIKEWKMLESPISVRDEWVSKPRYTNFFLLMHARETYELFHVHSAEQYRLLCGLREILRESAEGGHETASHYSLTEGITVFVKDGYLHFSDSDGNRLFEPPLSAEDFRRYPKNSFTMVCSFLGSGRRDAASFAP